MRPSIRVSPEDVLCMLPLGRDGQILCLFLRSTERSSTQQETMKKNHEPWHVSDPQLPHNRCDMTPVIGEVVCCWEIGILNVVKVVVVLKSSCICLCMQSPCWSKIVFVCESNGFALLMLNCRYCDKSQICLSKTGASVKRQRFWMIKRTITALRELHKIKHLIVYDFPFDGYTQKTVESKRNRCPDLVPQSISPKTKQQ